MDELFRVILLMVLIPVMIIGGASYENKAKVNVENDLQVKGCQEIEVKRIWALGKRELTFDVKYRNRQGEMTTNTCVIAAGWFSPGDIYWKNPI
jgi:hypothetical protein